MRLDHIVTQRDDIIDGQFRRRMRVEHRCMIDMFFFTGDRRFNRQKLCIDVCPCSAQRSCGGRAPT